MLTSRNSSNPRFCYSQSHSSRQELRSQLLLSQYLDSSEAVTSGGTPDANGFVPSVSSDTFSSMGKRLELRFGLALPVRIWGLDADGQVFEEEAITIDVTTTGARLRGVTRSLHRGGIIGIRHRNSSARYRVTWVRKEENSAGYEIGVQLLEGGKFIWGRVLPRVFLDRPNEPPRSNKK